MSQFTSDWYEAQLAKQRGWLKPAVSKEPERTKSKIDRKNRPLEKVIQQQIAKHLDSIGQCYYVWHRTDRAHTCAVGTPDFIGVWRGVPFAIEAKRPGQRPTPEQASHLLKATLAGITTCVVFSLEDAKRFLSTLPFDNS